MSKEGEKKVPITAKKVHTSYPAKREKKINKAVEQAKMIHSGKLPRKTAREFLKESRNSKG
ncbi:MAG: hypothetical protein H0Z32_07790 [Bacillaceae bacterium]|nr:hypothetical protein [Bacillaceae bacterium]